MDCHPMRTSYLTPGSFLIHSGSRNCGSAAGREGPVSEYVLSQPGAVSFVDEYARLFEPRSRALSGRGSAT